MNSEQRFRFRAYSPRRLESARWHLFEFDQVRDVAHVEGDVVVVHYEGAPQSTTIVFPAPIDMIKPFIENLAKPRELDRSAETERRQAA